MAQDGSHIVLFRNKLRQEVFLVRRNDYPIWVTQGGGIDKGEAPKQAALREMQEETGFKVKITRKVGVYSKKNYKSHLYEGIYISDKYKPELPGNIGNWFRINKLPYSTTNRTKIKIKDCINHKGKPFNKDVVEIFLRNNLHLVLVHPFFLIKYLMRNK